MKAIFHRSQKIVCRKNDKLLILESEYTYIRYLVEYLFMVINYTGP